jgi:hypothetical protein
LGRHGADECFDQRHAVTSVAHLGMDAMRGLAGTAIDDGNEVIGDNDTILTVVLQVLADDVLLYDIQCDTISGVMTQWWCGDKGLSLLSSATVGLEVGVK